MTVKILDIFAINEPKNPNEDSKSEWVKVGVAFENKDGSLNCIFDALPLSGRAHIRARTTQEVTKGKK